MAGKNLPKKCATRNQPTKCADPLNLPKKCVDVQVCAYCPDGEMPGEAVLTISGLNDVTCACVTGSGSFDLVTCPASMFNGTWTLTADGSPTCKWEAIIATGITITACPPGSPTYTDFYALIELYILNTSPIQFSLVLRFVSPTYGFRQAGGAVENCVDCDCSPLVFTAAANTCTTPQAFSASVVF